MHVKNKTLNLTKSYKIDLTQSYKIVSLGIYISNVRLDINR